MESERMVINFRCPTCGAPLQGVAGLYFQCPLCGARGTAPQTGPLARVITAPVDLPQEPQDE